MVMNLFTQLRPEHHAAPPERLLDLPVTVLKAIDETRAAALREVFGVHTLRELAAHPGIDWVWRTYRLFRAGVQPGLPADAAEHVQEGWQERSCGDWLASPLTSLRGLSPEAAQRLAQALGWTTVRQMASDGACETAREVSRIVTGRPEAPEATATRPLPDYFASGTQRFLERAREQAGSARGAPAAPPPPPPPASPSASTAAPAGALTAPTPRVAPAADEAGAWPPTDMPQRRHKDYAADGTYMPKGGGSRGWVENEGVAKAERGNRYRYHEMVDRVHYRRSALEEQVRVNNRGAERKELRMQVRWCLDPAVPPMPGLCLDVSLTGAKLRLNQPLRAGTPVQVAWVHRDDLVGTEHPVLELAARAVWNRSVNPNYRQQRYDTGVEFEPLELAAQERLTLLLTDRVDELLKMGASAEAEPEQRWGR
jgi:hypothetical protein